MISVIIPNKKGRKLRTSLNNQTFKDFELIVIKDEHLKGQSWALNRGIEKAKGEYYMFLDDDLDIADSLLDDLYNAIKDTKHTIAYCNFDRKGKVNGNHKANEWDYDTLKKHNYISNCSLVVAKDFPKWDENIHRLKDWDMWLTLAEKGCTGVWVDKTLFTAYYDEDGISSNSDGGKSEKIVKDKHNL